MLQWHLSCHTLWCQTTYITLNTFMSESALTDFSIKGLCINTVQIVTFSLCLFSVRLQAERAAGSEPRHFLLGDRQRQGDAGHLVVDP